jgi:muramidase (phage lysozyme)
MKRRDFITSAALAATGAVAAGRLRDRTLPMVHRLYDALGAGVAMASEGGGEGLEAAIADAAVAYYLTVCNAEGTYDDSTQTWEQITQEMIPYRTVVGHGLVPLDEHTWDDHPGKRNITIAGFPQYFRDSRGRLVSSDASGSGQFISTTWDMVVDQFPEEFTGPKWSPENQDKAFFTLHAITRGHHHLRNSVKRTNDGWIHINFADWARAIYNDSSQWASLPGRNIGEDTGQSTKGQMFLWTRFTWELNRRLGLHRHVQFPVQGYDYNNAPWTSNANEHRRHPVTGEPRPHRGVDIGIPEGTPILATEDAQITSAGWDNSGAGNVMTYVPTAEQTAVIRLFHLKEFRARPGDIVKKGDVIALSGNTGMSTGPHLHFEYWPHGHWTNPRFYLKQGVVYA